MQRISRHLLRIRQAELLAQRSTCYRRNVGCVITVDHRIVAEGYNGAPAGEPHCIGKDCAPGGVCTRAVHAEINALQQAHRALSSLSTHSKARLYCTESPCPDCALLIGGINRISETYYLHEYRLRQGVEILLRRTSMMVARITPSGYLIDQRTGELVDAQ